MPVFAARSDLDAPGAQRFFINVGRLDKINEGAIVRLVCDHSGIRSQQIGRIELKREFSFFRGGLALPPIKSGAA
jgi:ATP-dependent RNA helicase DeaD